MLNLYLRWFESEPVDALLPAKGADVMTDLAALGAFHASRRTRRVQCKDCGRQQARHVYEAGEHRLLPCMECGGQVESQGPPFESVQLQREWLPETLSRQMAGERAKPTVLLAQRLWNLASIDTPRGDVSVVLLRCGWQVDHAEVVNALRKILASRLIILTTSRMHHDALGKPGWSVVPLIGVAKLETNGLWLEREALIERQIRADPSSRNPQPHSSAGSEKPLWFEMGPDNAWLRVRHRQLSLRGKQRAFVASIARAHERGRAHHRLSDAVTDANYDRDIRSLQQICTRREFRDFIGVADGFVWIRDDVD